MVLRHKGYGVYITCDGQPLAEYNFQVEDPLTVSCYVPSEKGKNFAIHWVEEEHPEHVSLQHGPLAKAVQFFMDSPAPVAAHWSQPGEAGSCTGSPVANIGVRSFQFASIITTDDDALATRNDARHEKLGTIEAKFKRTIAGYAAPIAHGTQYNHDDPGPVHERSKKAGAHRVGFGDLQVQQINFCSPTYIDVEYFAVFRFYYRSVDLLQAQGIMPPASRPRSITLPPPRPGPSKRVKRERDTEETELIMISDNDSEDEAELKRKLKSIENKLARKKARKSDVEAKKEPGQVGDVIDLT